MKKNPRVVLAGGVSGGHTFPLIAVAQSLQKKYPGGIEYLFIGSKGPVESEAMAQQGIPAKYVLTGKWRRYFSLQNVIDLFKIPLGFFQALWYLFLFLPDAVFAKGGSASVPVVLAAWLYRIPIIIHDSDATVGYANRFLARFATRIAIAYPSAREFLPEKKTALTGNPVRQEITQGNKERALLLSGLSSEKPTLLVIGGSLGATVLNEIILKALPELLAKGIQVYHQTGKEHFEAIKNAVIEYKITLGSGGYFPKDLLTAEELADALSLASVVLSRSGAGSVSDIAANKKATILVPFAAAANDEQRLNAYEIAKIGGALVLEEANLVEHILLEKIDELLSSPELRQSMGEKMSAFYHPDAADAIAEGLYSLMNR